jgi:lipid II:glycine glycyltransferase (peptidoglycan interpeptide bridge formation enzyme)
MAPYAVQWAAIQWAKNNGCWAYDLWGIPDEDLETLESEFIERQNGLWGVYRFKRGFGGIFKRSMGAWDRVYNRILYLFYLLWVKKSQT